MYSEIRAGILDRVFSTQLFLQSAASLAVPRASPLSKGLVFVQLYAVHEYAIQSSVMTALASIASHRIPVQKLKRGLQSLAVDHELIGLAACARSSSWSRRLALLEKLESESPADFEAITFPADGSHYRPAQILTLWTLFELPPPAFPHSKWIGRIDEFVEHRNAIAHGRETADKIGCRFTDAEIAERITDTQAICLHVVNSFEDHCSQESFLCRLAPD